MRIFTLSAALLLTACVTINIYFPAAAAEKVADQIIQEIQQEKGHDQSVPDTVGPQSRSHRTGWQDLSLTIMTTALDFVISPARAGANLEINSPEIQRLKASMRQRFPALESAYDQGWVGLKADGFLTVRGNVPLRDRNRVNKLVTAENNDRRRLYQAIANANGQPQWYEQIRQTFAKRWISHAHRGWWIQKSNGQWVRK